MKRVIRLMALICGAFACLQAAPALADKRVALSVGIDVYDNLPAHEQLKKAVNDARAVGAALRELGFETAVEENVAKLAFTRAWQRFLNRLEPGDTAAVFIASHGVEIAGQNYLLPRDVPKVELGEDKVLTEASIRFNGLMDDLRAKKARVSLFIVDACRDSPFRDPRGRGGVGGTRGLAVVEPAKGSFVMYSAGAGERALDRLSAADAEPNSPCWWAGSCSKRVPSRAHSRRRAMRSYGARPSGPGRRLGLLVRNAARVMLDLAQRRGQRRRIAFDQRAQS